MSIILLGYRGCGKTTIGRRLADRLWIPFVDVDDLIVKKAGKSIVDIFQQDGEGPYRDIESQVVREVSALEDHVIGMGGGSLMREENRQVLKDAKHKFFYLRCEPEELLRRVQADPRSEATRPNLSHLGGGIEEIRHMLGQREPVYREVADMELDVTRLTPDEAVIYLARHL